MSEMIEDTMASKTTATEVGWNDSEDTVPILPIVRTAIFDLPKDLVDRLELLPVDVRNRFVTNSLYRALATTKEEKKRAKEEQIDF